MKKKRYFNYKKRSYITKNYFKKKKIAAILKNLIKNNSGQKKG